jgi:hypothetical protein
MKRIAQAVGIVAVLSTLAGIARAQHAGDMIMGSTASGSGALAIDYDFAAKVVVTPSFSFGGQTLYTATDPGFDALVVAEPPSFYPLAAGTPVRVELTAVASGLAMKVGATTLDAPGESALLGTMPSLHVHPEWQLLLADGVFGDYAVSFRLTTTSGAYTASAAYTATVTNIVPPATTTTTSTILGTTSTSTSTTTSTTLPSAGQLLDGKKLVLKAKPGDPSKRALVVLSKDPDASLGAGNGSGDDPTLVGGTLRVRSTGGDPFDATYPLPAERWEAIGAPGAGKGYKYTDRALAAGPVKVAIVRSGKLAKAVAKGAALVHALGGDPEPVAVELRIGGHAFCLGFGGTTSFTPGKLFKAKDAPAPGACPP